MEFFKKEVKIGFKWLNLFLKNSKISEHRTKFL